MRKIFLALSVIHAFVSAAPQQSALRVGWPAAPSSLLYYLAYDQYSEMLTDLLLEPLIRLDTEGRVVPTLTRKFRAVSLREFELDLNPDFTFSDGSKVTPEDIIATWAAVTGDEASTGPLRLLFKKLKRPEKTGKHRIRIRTEQNLPRPFDLFRSFYVLSQRDLSQKKLADFPNGFRFSGPYQLDTLLWGQRIALTRRVGYPPTTLKFPLPTIEVKQVADPSRLLEELRLGKIDYYVFHSSKLWATENIDRLAPQHLKKVEIPSELPYSLTAIAWNLRDLRFQDPRTRRALQLLLDRPRIIRELLYDAYVPIPVFFHHRSPYHDPKLTALPYAPEEARRLLGEAGWTRGHSGLLEKGGRAFEFELIVTSANSTRVFSWYQEALAQAGIKMRMTVLDWSLYLERRSRHQFDAIEFSRERDRDGGELELTLGSHSDGAAGFAGYTNPNLDSLIRKAGDLPDGPERNSVWQAAERLLAAEVPFTVLWESSSFRIAYWDRYQMPAFGRYATWRNLFYDWQWDGKKSQAVDAVLAGKT